MNFLIVPGVMMGILLAGCLIVRFFWYNWDNLNEFEWIFITVIVGLLVFSFSNGVNFVLSDDGSSYEAMRGFFVSGGFG